MGTAVHGELWERLPEEGTESHDLEEEVAASRCGVRWAPRLCHTVPQARAQGKRGFSGATLPWSLQPHRWARSESRVP